MSAATHQTSDNKLRIAGLISGGGSTVLNLQDCINNGTLNAEIVCVICSNDHAAGIERLQKRGIPVHVVNRKQFKDTDSFSDQIWQHIRSSKADLVCLAGFLSLLHIPDDYLGRVMNIHPALLPAYGGKGMYGHHVHEAVIEAGEKESGCTVHFANNEYDTGPIILQRQCPVLPDDTPDTLAERVMSEERKAYPEAIRLFAAGQVQMNEPGT